MTRSITQHLHHIGGSALLIFMLASGSAAAQEVPFQFLFPPPGAEHVCPDAEIMVRTGAVISPAELQHFQRTVVTGARSGSHTVRARLADDGTIALLNLTEALTPGEHVVVRFVTGPDDRSTTASSGYETSFTVSRNGCEPSDRTTWSDLFSSQHQRSSTLPSGLPNIQVEQLAPSYGGRMFLAPMNSNTHQLILNNDGGAYYHSDPSQTRVLDLRPVNDTLVYYGLSIPDPCYILADAQLNAIDTVRCQNGYQVDLHDLVYLPNGHIVLMSYDGQPVDMSLVVPGGNPNATVVGLVLQELDQGRNVVFQWRSWDHFQITDAQSVGAVPFDFTGPALDYVHGNSVDVLPNGDLLISSRHMNEVTRINRLTGDVVWRMGGSNNEFTFVNDPLNGFHSQHDARMLPNGHITIFDNGLGHTPARSRVVEYALDEDAHTANLVWSYQRPDNATTVISGNAQHLPNGNTFINWANPLTGQNLHTMMEEVDAAGNAVLRVFVPDTSAFEWTYRGYMADWPSGSNTPEVKVALKVFLGGPFNDVTGLMNDDLRAASLLPATEPYTALGYAYTGTPGAGNAVQPEVFLVTGDDAIVDWVVVELRDESDPAIVVASCSALVQRDGDVVDLGGVSPVGLTAPLGAYHIAVRHRNHLGVMTANPIALTGTPAPVDFTTPAMATHGTDALRTIGGFYVLRTGDANADHRIRYTGSGNDRDPILLRVGSTTPNNSVSGYFTEDANMNGIVTYTGSGNDRDRVLLNVGGSTPNNTRTEQLP